MALAKAQELITKAQLGNKLTARERRHAVAFLMATQPEISTSEMSQMFGVIERQIRFDKQHIREERSKLITDEDVGLVIADIRISYENAARELHQQMRKSKEGTQVRLNYITAIHTLYLKTVEALQNLGYYPKNLGSQTINKFEYRAVVDMVTGNVETRQLNEMDYLLDKKTLQENSAVLDVDFVEIPQLPAPQDAANSGSNSGTPEQGTSQ
jgi:hypothetical protein